MRERSGTDGTWWTSFVLAVSGFWFGFTVRLSAADATGKPAVVKASVDPYEKQIAEMHQDTLRGFDNRLAFEVWADGR